MALAFYRTAKAENKQRLKVTLIPLIVTSVLVGITEPFEFLFIFTAPLLWLIYSLLDGFFQMLAWLLHVRSAPLTVSSISSSINLPGGSQRDALAGVCRPRSAGNRDHVPGRHLLYYPSAAAHPRAAKPQPKMSIRNRLIASIRIKARW